MSEFSFQSLLLSILQEKLPEIPENKRKEIADIMSAYINALNKGEIEEADKIIHKNMALLERIL